MKRLVDYSKILRSKNAGPLYITFDLIFCDQTTMEYVLGHLTRERVAEVYGANPSDVDIIGYKVVNAIKITMPRKYISGSFEDNDIYGCQQHIPLANIEV